MSTVIEQSKEMFKGLYQMMVSNTQNVLTLKELITNLRDLHQNFSIKMQELSEKFHLEISQETGEHDALVFCYQYLSNYLLQVKESHTSLSRSLTSQVLQPYEMFIQNFRITNRTTSELAKAQLEDLTQSRKVLLKLQQSYWADCKRAEKSNNIIEQTMSLMEKGEKTKQDLLKASEKAVELKLKAEEQMINYKQQVGVVNGKWDQFELQFENVFDNFDNNNQSRISFSQATIHSIVQLLTNFSVKAAESQSSYQDKFKELDERFQLEQKQTSLKLLSRGSLILFKQKNKKEEFISYEVCQKMEENIKKGSNEVVFSDFEVVGETPINDIEQMHIESLITNMFDQNQSFLFENSQKKRKQSQGGQLEDQKESFNSLDLLEETQEPVYQKQESTSSVKDRKSLEKKIADNEYQGKGELEKMTDDFYISLLQQRLLRDFFLENFEQNLKANQKGLYINLNYDKFLDLVQIFSGIFTYMEEFKIENTEEIYKILTIVNQIVIKSNQATKQHLGLYLNKFSILTTSERWEKIYQYIDERKRDEQRKTIQILRQSSPLLKDKSKAGLGIVQKGLTFFTQGLKIFQMGNKVEQQDEDDGINNQDIAYMILEEINLFLINLNLPSEFTSQVIINLAKKKDVKLNDVQKLLQQQVNLTDSKFRSSFNSIQAKKQQFTKKTTKFTFQDQTTYAISKALKFLSPYDNPFNLLLVNKDFHQFFNQQIYQIYLLRDSETINFLDQHRVAVWKNFLQIESLKGLNYSLIKSGITNQDGLSHIEEIINLDVCRSLHLHADVISQSTLSILLRMFVHLNPKISYLQGMNYIAGYLYLTILDEEDAYKAFHIVMNKYYPQLLNDNFDNLKANFYVLERLVSIFLPELSEHLKQLGIDANYYSTSWFITLFTSVFQYAQHSHLVDVIWDVFLIEQWKGFYQVSIYILRFLQSQLLQMDFDQTLHFLGELIKADIFLHDYRELKEFDIMPSISHFKKDIMDIKISNSLIASLQDEYKYFNINVQQKMDSKEEN